MVTAVADVVGLLLGLAALFAGSGILLSSLAACALIFHAWREERAEALHAIAEADVYEAPDAETEP